MDSDVNTVAFPCGHASSCYNCLKSLNIQLMTKSKCNYCQSNAQYIRLIYPWILLIYIFNMIIVVYLLILFKYF